MSKPKMCKCDYCNGTGAITCWDCDGTGEIEDEPDDDPEADSLPPPSTAAFVHSMDDLREHVALHWSGK